MKKYLQACVGARYWEDAILNGVEDIDKNMPCIDGDLWKPLINLETGIIENWIIGNTADIYYKSCDQNSFYLLDENKNIIPLDNSIYQAKYLSDISFSNNDFILNTLLSVLPKKIYLHLVDNAIDEFANTLLLIAV